MNPRDFILENDHPLKKRAAVFSSIFVAALLWMKFIDPFFTGTLQYYLCADNPGPDLLLRHIFTFGASYFLFSLACLNILTRLKIFNGISCAATKESVFQGLFWGTAVIAFALLQWLYYGLDFQFKVNCWSIAGNVFSNFYEEIIFRAFLFPLFYYLFGNIRPAVFFSSLIFAMVHVKYPLFLRFTVFVSGACLTISYIRSKTIFAPWLGHQLVDTVAEAIFKL